MATITPNLNWSGTLDGILYYMQDGKQRCRKAPKYRNTKPVKITDLITLPDRCAEPHVIARSVYAALAPELNALKTVHEEQRLTALFEKVSAKYGGAGLSLALGLMTDSGSERFQNFKFGRSLKNTPVLHAATWSGADAAFFPIPSLSAGDSLIFLEMDLATGEYEKHSRTVADLGAPHPFVMQSSLLKTNGNFPFAFIAGPGFLRGVVVRTQ